MSEKPVPGFEPSVNYFCAPAPGLEILEPYHVCTCICSKIIYSVQHVYNCTVILHNLCITLQHIILTRTAVLLLRFRNENNEVVNHVYLLLYACSLRK